MHLLMLETLSTKITYFYVISSFEPGTAPGVTYEVVNVTGYKTIS